MMTQTQTRVYAEGTMEQWIRHDLEAAILGAVLLDNAVLTRVQDWLPPAAFDQMSYRAVYTRFCDMLDKGRPIDLVTMGVELDQRPIQNMDALSQREPQFSVFELHRFMENIATAGNIRPHAELLYEAYQRRRLYYSCSTLMGLALDPTEALPDIQTAIAQRVQMNPVGVQDETFADIMTTTLARLERIYHGDTALLGCPTGLPALDGYLNGIRQGNLTIVAGRTAMGKTTFALYLAQQIAARGLVLMVSLETDSETLGERALSAATQIPLVAMEKPKGVRSHQWPVIAQVSGHLAPLAIRVTNHHRTLEQIVAYVRQLQPVAVIVDYLQLILPTTGTVSRQEQIAIITAGLKHLAVQENGAVIALAQVSRRAEDRAESRPQLADLRESGAIEQDADVVLFLYRPGYYKKASDPNELEIIVAKNRRGRVGVVHARLELETQRIHAREGESTDEEDADA